MSRRHQLLRRGGAAGAEFDPHGGASPYPAGSMDMDSALTLEGTKVLMKSGRSIRRRWTCWKGTVLQRVPGWWRTVGGRSRSTPTCGSSRRRSAILPPCGGLRVTCRRVPRLVLAGTNSGCGKTTVTCAVLQSPVRRGLRVGAANAARITRPHVPQPCYRRESPL